jgi:hypothetical protein
VPVDNITLLDLRADGAAMSQAIRMVDALDIGLQVTVVLLTFLRL